MRRKLKEWKNNRNAVGERVPFTCCISWYEDGDDIRICVEDSHQLINVVPATREKAEHLWFMFVRQAAPPVGCKEDIVKQVLDLAQQPGGPLEPANE